MVRNTVVCPCITYYKIEANEPAYPSRPANGIEYNSYITCELYFTAAADRRHAIDLLETYDTRQKTTTALVIRSSNRLNSIKKKSKRRLNEIFFSIVINNYVLIN